MPRSPLGVYTVPIGTDGVPDTTVESSKYNTFVHDVELDLNQPRPISAGGTGSNSAVSARFNLKAEACDQVVTNFDTHVFYPGSWYHMPTTSNVGQPVLNHAFAGIAYLNEALTEPPTDQNLVVEARDETSQDFPGRLYIREKRLGVWRGWSPFGAQRSQLLANVTYYINAGVAVPGNVPPIGVGNDANDGSAASPWKTMEKAILHIANTLDIGGYNVDVNCFGAFTVGVNLATLTRGTGIVHFIGDLFGGPTVTPTVSINAGSGDGISAINCGGGWKFSGFRVIAAGACVVSQGMSHLTLGNKMQYDNSRIHLLAMDGGTLFLGNSNYIMNGQPTYAHLNAQRSGVVAANFATLSILTPTSAVVGAFAIAEMTGIILTEGYTYTGINVTGPKFACETAGGINANGYGLYNLPGSLVGTVQPPGWYEP